MKQLLQEDNPKLEKDVEFCQIIKLSKVQSQQRKYDESKQLVENGNKCGKNVQLKVKSGTFVKCLTIWQ